MGSRPEKRHSAHIEHLRHLLTLRSPPFLEPLPDDATDRALVIAQIDAIGRRNYEMDDRFVDTSSMEAPEDLRAGIEANRDAWRVLRNMFGNVIGYTHIEIVSEAITESVIAGSGSEEDLTEQARKFTEPSSPTDYIHIGSLVRDSFDLPKPESKPRFKPAPWSFARLLAGTVYRVLEIHYGLSGPDRDAAPSQGPKRIIAFDYPAADHVSHSAPLLEYFGFRPHPAWVPRGTKSTPMVLDLGDMCSRTPPVAAQEWSEFIRSRRITMKRRADLASRAVFLVDEAYEELKRIVRIIRGGGPAI